MGFVVNANVDTALNNEDYIFEATVKESNKNIKVLKIIRPYFLRSTYVVFKTDKELNTGDILHIYGTLKELSVTYKNPYIFSWKWLKQLEGINFELKGEILKIKEGERVIDNIRSIIKEKIEHSQARHQGIIKALILGDRISIDEETKTIFQKTGTSHILAISGLHIGIITGFFFFIFKRILGKKRSFALSGKNKRYSAIITVIFPILFMVLSGANVSTIRATFMVSIFLFAIFFERQRDIFNTIFLSALLILLLYPHSLFTPSFQLSFLSVIFIVSITMRIYPLINIRIKSLKWLLLTIISTISAVIGTLPIVLYHFYGFNPFCILHNIISIPLMCFLSLPLIFLGVFLPFGEHLIFLAGEVINANLIILKTLDFGYIFPSIRPNLFESLIFYAFVLCILFFKKSRLFSVLYFLLVLVIISYTFFDIQKRYFNSELCVNFIDVGMGDAILVEAPYGKRILIDGGSAFKEGYNVGKNIITPILLSKKILTLDYVINTHPHGDHIGGLPYILKNFSVKKFITSGYFLNEPLFLDIMDFCKQKKIDFILWHKGDGFSEDKFSLTVLNPENHLYTQNLNNASLVIKIMYKNISLLLTGDIEKDIEEKLVLDTPLKAQVLKVPHHGSNHSSSLAFLLGVKPEIAVLSVGKGIKGLPGNDALNRYKKLSIPVLSTLNNGFIKICTNGEKISIKTIK